MLLLGYFETRRCRSSLTENWPCIFKQSRYHDTPFWLMLDAEARLWAFMGESTNKIQMFVKQDLINYLLSSLCIKHALRMHQMSRAIIRSFAFTSNAVVPVKKKVKSSSSMTRSKTRVPASLLSLPTELRMKIFAYVTTGAEMKVVGYRRDFGDVFYFKERGNCSVAMTCKKFHEEALEVYFKNLHVTLKAASPSEFSGDMSSLGTAQFRNRIKSIKISDWDTIRRSKMCLAFRNADIELGDKCASGARKGAYYFG